MYTFPKLNRLLKKSDFENMRGVSKKIVLKSIIIYIAKNNLPKGRLGLAISTKFGSAVKRNKFKRIFREIFRKNLSIKNSGLDILVTPNFYFFNKKSSEIGQQTNLFLLLNEDFNSLIEKINLE